MERETLREQQHHVCAMVLVLHQYATCENGIQNQIRECAPRLILDVEGHTSSVDMRATKDAALVAPAQVKARVCAVSSRLLRCLTMSFGPRGRAHVVQANAQSADALTVTASAAKYLRTVRFVSISA